MCLNPTPGKSQNQLVASERYVIAIFILCRQRNKHKCWERLLEVPHPLSKCLLTKPWRALLRAIYFFFVCVCVRTPAGGAVFLIACLGFSNLWIWISPAVGIYWNGRCLVHPQWLRGTVLERRQARAFKHCGGSRTHRIHHGCALRNMTVVSEWS